MKKSDIKDIYPLSPLQEGLMFHQLLDKDSSAYFEQIGHKILAQVDVAHFEESWNRLMLRHDILRTVFDHRNAARPLQIVLKERRVGFRFTDLRGQSAQAQQTALADYRRRDRERPFNLSSDVLLRLRLFQLEPEAFYLVLSYPHLLLDGWSIGLLYGEFEHIYRALVAGEQPQLPPPVAYGQFIRWLETRDESADAAFWRDQLAGCGPATGVPQLGDNPAQAGAQTSCHYRFSLDQALSNRMRDLARRNRVTLNTVVQALWSVWLARGNGCGDLAFGMTTSIRPAEIPQVERLAGLLINTVPLRVQLHPDLSFQALMHRIQDQALELARHAHYPLPKILGLAPVKDVFDHLLVFENYPIEEKQGASDALRIGDVSFHEEIHYNLGLVIAPGPCLSFTFKYKPECYHPDQFPQIAAHLTRLAQSFCEDEEQRLADCPLMGEAERHKVLTTFNQSHSDYPRTRTVHSLFSEAQARHRTNTALIQRSERLDYAGLETRANRLANHLVHQCGIRPGTRVGIMMERSMEGVAAMLAILKAGGAYVPLDPHYPAERTAYLLEIAGCPLVLAAPDLKDRLPAHIEALCPQELPQTGPSSPPQVQVQPGDPAYVMFTSGSTGRPKGVLVPHRAIVRLVKNTNYLRLAPDDHILQTGSMSFDAATFEIWGALLHGAALYLPADKEVLEADRLKAIISQHRIRVMWVTAGLFNQLVDRDAAMFKGLRCILTGGEKLSPVHVNKLRHAVPGLQVINGYGPTENTTFTTFFPIERDFSGDIPIGKPIANTRVYVLDPQLKPVPIGVAGRLWIAGDGLAQGYLVPGGMSQERFAPCPFAPGERMYDSGDMARWLPDGNLAFLGRQDAQVKVRGYRIECGEIEHALSTHPDIRETLVMARPTKANVLELVAYLVSSRELALGDLRAHLRDSLPDYMIPSHFVRMDSFPLNPNKKVDRHALPDPEQAGLTSGNAYAAPQNEIQQQLAAIWAQVLGRAQLGIDDHFFDMGGDSIKAIQIMARMNKVNLKCEIRSFFTHPTIRAISQQVTIRQRQAPQDMVTGELPLTPVLHWFFRQVTGAKHHFNQSILLRSETRLNGTYLAAVFEALVQHHDALRLVVRHGAQATPGLRFAPPFEPAVPLVDLSRDPGAEASLQQHAERAQTRFDLEHGPLLNLVHFRLPQSDALLIVLHHLVVDGVSWRILLEDLAQGYGQALNGEAIAFPPKTHSFKAWAEDLIQAAQSEAMSAELTYWNSLGRGDGIPLPVRDDRQQEHGEVASQTVSATLDPALTAQLLSGAGRAFNTQINDLLLSALAIALHEWNGHRATPVSLESHGRVAFSNLDLSRTVGWFTAIYPVLLPYAGGALEEQIKHTKEMLRRVPRDGVGFGLLRYLTDQPLQTTAPAIAFNYLGQFEHQLPGGHFLFRGEAGGNPVAADVRQPGDLVFNASVIEGRFSLAVTFNAAALAPEKVDALLAGYLKALHRLVTFCVEREHSELTPSDLTLDGLDLDRYRGLLAKAGLAAHQVEDVYPLTPMQEGLLFHYLYDPEGTAFFQQMGYRIQGQLQPAHFRNAWDALLARHTVLRTLFVYRDQEKPLQIVLKERHLDFSYADLTAKGVTDPESGDRWLRDYMERDRKNPFDLSRDVIMRIALFRVGAEDYRMVWSFHHIILDGWCLPLLYGEMLQVYQSLIAGRNHQLPPARPFSDYAAWLAKRDWPGSKQFWQSYIGGYARTASVPPCLPAPSAGGDLPVTATYLFWLDAAQHEALKKIAARHAVTLNTLVQCAWAMLLQHYSGGDDLVFGAAVSGRPDDIAGVENMVGLFMNTLPKRVRLTGCSSFVQLLKQTQADALATKDHQFYPLARIQSMSPLKQALFDHILVFENFPDSMADGAQGRAGLRFSTLDLYQEINYGLGLLITPGQGIEFRFLYDPKVYSQAQMTQMETFLQSVFNAVIADDLCLLSNIPIGDGQGPVLDLTRLEEQVHAHPLRKALAERITALDPDAKTATVYTAAGRPAPECAAGGLVLDSGGATGFLARWLWNGQLELLREPADMILNGDLVLALSQLEDAIANLDSVQQCRIIKRNGGLLVLAAGQNQGCEAQILEVLAGTLAPGNLARLSLAVLPSLFELADDPNAERFLQRLPLLEPGFAYRLEQEAAAHDGLLRVAVKAGLADASFPPLHIRDLAAQQLGQLELAGDARQQAPEDEVRQGDQDLAAIPRAYSNGGQVILPPEMPKTLVEALYYSAEHFAHHGTVYVFRDGSEHYQSYADLLHEASCILNGLLQKGLKTGDPIILQFDNLRDHLTSFWACIMGGIRPVTVAVSHTYEKKTGVVTKLYNAWKMLDQPFILTGSHLVGSINGLNALFETEGIRAISVEGYEPITCDFRPDPGEVAFYQLSSGSTGIPKCIQERHRGVYYHCCGAAQYNNYTSEDVYLTWPPADHVGALLTLYIKALFMGNTQLAVNTDLILEQPLKWLDLCEQYKVTFTWAPNFGYKLVADQLKTSNRTWDLSSVRFWMNAAEQVTYPVCKEFLALTEPFGVPQHAMQPAYGMAETCTAMQYMNDFHIDTGFHWVEKSSLKGILRQTDNRGKDSACFVDLGLPMPGLEIRIVDDRKQLVPEGKIGALHIRGEVITPGYLNNPEANKAAFVGDDWFNTGDLGFIRNGRLSITGRQKEMIIIRGANFYCYEIEDVVNNVPGLEPTFSGCTAINDPATGSEGLAVFFCPKPEVDLIDLIKKIRLAIANEFGITPHYVIPVEKETFPKTTSGKIQRTQLREQLEDSSYDAEIKQIDIALANDRTLPDWFFRIRWQPHTLNAKPLNPQGSTLLLCDHPVLAEQLRLRLAPTGQTLVLAQSGPTFATRGPHAYNLNPEREEDYAALIADLEAKNLAPSGVIHAFAYRAGEDQPDTGDPAGDAEALQRAQFRGSFSLTFLAKALAARLPRRFLLVSGGAQLLDHDAPFHVAHATLPGLIKTLAAENPAMLCRHLDFDTRDPLSDAQLLAHEFLSGSREPEVAYRASRRLLPMLEKIDFSAGETQPVPLQEGGFYLVTGGLGAIGAEIAAQLLVNHDAKLLLVGRSPLAGNPQREETLARLSKAGRGQVTYRVADIGDRQQLEQAVQEGCTLFDQPLAGIFHLAGVPAVEHGQADLSAHHLTATSLAAFDRMYRAKLFGSVNLARLLSRFPQAVLVNFSSVNGFFGGSGFGTYAAAGSFLEGLSRRLRQQGRKAYCLSWSMWEDMGMSAGNDMKSAVFAKGFHGLSQRQGIQSFHVAMAHGPSHWLIGLNPNNKQIQARMAPLTQGEPYLAVYYQPKDGAGPVTLEAQLREMSSAAIRRHCRPLADGQPAQPPAVLFRALADWPLGPSGLTDRLALPALAPGDREQSAENPEPRTPMEEQLIRIWADVLGVRHPSIYDNFFELGGDSIKAIQIMSRLQAKGLKCEMAHLFQYPVIARLAGFVTATGRDIDQGAVTGPVPLMPIQQRFFRTFVGPMAHYNQAILLHSESRLDVAALKQVLTRLLTHHDALRATYRLDTAPVTQQFASEMTLDFQVEDLRTEKEDEAHIEELVNRANGSIDLARGPLFKAILFQRAHEDALFLAVHHLAIDGVSWRILYEDIASAYPQAQAGRPIKLPPKTHALKDWCRHLAQLDFADELPFWQEMAAAPVPRLPQQSQQRGLVGDSRTLSFTLSREETESLLSGTHHAYNTRINDILLAALCKTLIRHLDGDRIRIALESHGRDVGGHAPDISRTVGWFTSIFPVLFHLPQGEEPATTLKRVKETLRTIPRNGAGYGVLREWQNLLPDPEGDLITFNYLGRFDQNMADRLFRFDVEGTGATVSPESQLNHDLSFAGITLDHRFSGSVNFNPERFPVRWVQAILDGFRAELLGLVSHCRQVQRSEVTPSDLTWPKLSLAGLDRLAARSGLALHQVGDLYPLSPMQGGMLFEHLLDRDDAAYVLQFDYRTEGPLDPVLFEQAWNLLFERHDILRTQFLYEGLDTPLQLVLRQRKVDFAVHDLANLAEEDGERRIAAFKEQDRARGFDPTRDVLMRLTVFHLGPQLHRIVWTFHHIILDGWCFGIMYREFLEAYRALAESRVPQLEQVTPYAHYIQWLSRQDQSASAQFWAQYLADFDAVTGPPKARRLRSGPAARHHEYLLFEWDRGTAARLRERAAREQVTLYTLIQTIWGLLLGQYNNCDDVVFGMTVSGRPEEIKGIENILGLFINTIPTRIQTGSNPSFGQLLRQVQERSLAAKDHHHYPLYRIEAAREGDAHLFDHLIAFENYPFDQALREHRFPYFQIIDVDLFEQINYDFGLFITPMDSIRFRLEYHPDSYDAAQMKALQGHLGRLVAQLLEDESIKVRDLDILGQVEWERLLVQWNRTAADFPRQSSVHRLFEAQVRATPQATALVCGSDRLSYDQLNPRANRLAHRLIHMGAAPGERVGLCLPRCSDLPVALLAVLKTGAAYVPLDPDLPADRKALMIEDSGLRILLGHSTLPAEQGADIRHLQVDRLEDGPAAWDENPAVPAHPESLAYVIYTSGSTGRPKGVAVTHANLVNFLAAMGREPGLNKDDVLLSVTTVSFDIAGLELYLPLINGARLVLAEADACRDPHQLARLLDGHQVTMMQATPATWRMLAPVWHGRPDFKVLCGGEALPMPLLETLLRWQCPVWNLYGPTETTIWSTALEIRRLPADQTAHASIGSPIANTQIYVLNDRLQPVPQGVTGHLYIAGDGVAQGYHRRPALTAERFLPNPFAQQPGARMYFTGDLVRYLPNGQLEFLGRSDHQVKIRGYRIELGEIEAALNDHPSVRHSAVILTGQAKTGDGQLAAYVVPGQAGEGPSATGDDQLEHWADAWSSVYRDAAPDAPAQFNLAGWQSSYTGQPIPEAEMREWVEGTVTRILTHRPRRVLEIGCGTGLLATRIAPHCTAYHGTDISHEAVAGLEAVRDKDPKLANLVLHHAAAHQLDALRGERFDMIVLNSVIQYFPGMDYLLQVLDNLAELAAAGGVIFLGDVRNRALNPAFHFSVQRHQSPADTPLRQLVTLAARRCAQEVELVVDPAFFHALPQRPNLPIAQVHLLPKPGQAANEMNLFRYDAILHLAKETPSADAPCPWETWPQITAQDQLQAHFAQEHRPAFAWRHVPCGPAYLAQRAFDLAQTAEEGHTAAGLPSLLAREQAALIDLQQLQALALSHGYAMIRLTPAQNRPGTSDLLFHRPDHCPNLTAPDAQPEPKPWAGYANNPLQGRLLRDLAPQLRAYLASRLPEYMVPAALVMMERLPLTPNGKLDRKSLPAPGELQAGTRDVAAPRNDCETTLAALWTQTLGLARPSIHDHFFRVGGHSILAVNLISNINQAFEISLSLTALFDHPTIAGLAELIDRTKRSSVALELDGKTHYIPQIVPQPDARLQPFSLTPIQQAYWLGRGNAYDLGNVATHAYLELDCPGLDLSRLEQAWHLLMARHDMLRMRVLPSGEQQVLDQVHYPIEALDLRQQPQHAAQEALDQVRERMSHQVLPAERWPLFELRASLLPDGLTRLHISFDMLIADAWSSRVLARDLLHFYHQPEQPLPPLEISFRDYVVTEEKWQHTAWYQAAHSYWMNRAATLPPAPELPLARDPQSLAQPRFRRRSHQLDAPSWTRIKALCGQAGISPSGFLLAAFSEVLALWSRESRFTLNLTLFNRFPVHPQVNEIVGDFTSLTLLEIDSLQGRSFSERARAVQKQLWRDLDHRQVNGVQVLRTLSRARGKQIAMPVVFTSTLTLEDGAEAIAFPSLGEEVYSITQTPQVWMDHQVREQADKLFFNWDCLDDLFPEGMLDDMFAAYCTLLATLAQDSARWEAAATPARLPAWQHERRLQVNRTQAPLPGDHLHTPFLQAAQLHPQRPAVICGPHTLSYGELAQHASAAAQLLRQRGIGPNDLVAVVMDKGWEQVAAVLAVLMAGGAYVPIDPKLPEARIAYLFETCAIRQVLTQTDVDARLSWPQGPERHCLDRLPAPATAPDLEALGSTPLQKRSDLAYIIFTSGSTGLPKGVMIDHRAAVNTVHDINRRFAVGPEDRVLALSDLNFDLSVWDVFGLLAAGGTVVIPQPEQAREPAQWAELVRRHRITLWNSVPALMQMFVDDQQGKNPPTCLRLCMMSGDWIPLDLPPRIQALWPACKVVSLGGATEAAIWSIFFPIDKTDPGWTSIPYGQPLTNQQFHVLNARMDPCPVWVPGQLYIAGSGLAQGYFADRQKTEASFIVHPQSGERLYRTGDLGRYLPDGNIEFLGREDFQVKVRGYRIELGEIEVAIKQHKAVHQTVVQAEGPRENKHLVAYVVGEPQQADDYGWEETLAGALATDRDALLLRDTALRRRYLDQRAWAPAPDEVRPKIALELPAPTQKDAAKPASPGQAAALTPPNLSSFLACLMHLRMEGSPMPKYRYPSAGNLYPVQVYLWLRAAAVTGFEAGLYYYHPGEHRLVLVHSGDLDPALGACSLDTSNEAGAPAFCLFLVAKPKAVTPLYGNGAIDFCVLEGGYMSQLLMDAAAECGLAMRPLSGLGAQPAAAWFDGELLLQTFQVNPESSPTALTAAQPLLLHAETPDLLAAYRPMGAGLAMQEDVILDPVAQLEFKFSQPGLRPCLPRERRLALNRPELDEHRLHRFTARQSYRQFQDTPIPLTGLARLLADTVQQAKNAGPHFATHPGLDALQVFLTVKPGKVAGLDAGIYRYHPAQACLEQVHAGADEGEVYGDYGDLNQLIYQQSAFSIFMLADLDALHPLLGARSRDAALLDAGALSQRLMELAPHQGLGLCPIGNLDFKSCRGRFAPQPGLVFLHSFLGGHIVEAQTRRIPKTAHHALSLAEKMRHFLADKLPEYMIPFTYVPLEALPLTPNGKVDRKALPSADARPARERSFQAPASPTESLLAAFWCDLLAVGQVSVNADFFEIGGDSLIAVRLLTRIKDTFQVDLSLRQLFARTTIAQMAQFLDAVKAAEHIQGAQGTLAEDEEEGEL